MERTKNPSESQQNVARVHEIKEHPGPFAELATRKRAVEVRLNDRDFQVGDRLVIREWDPKRLAATNAFVTCWVRSVTTARDWGGMLEGLLDPRVAILGLTFPEDLTRDKRCAACNAELEAKPEAIALEKTEQVRSSAGCGRALRFGGYRCGDSAGVEWGIDQIALCDTCKAVR